LTTLLRVVEDIVLSALIADVMEFSVVSHPLHSALLPVIVVPNSVAMVPVMAASMNVPSPVAVSVATRLPNVMLPADGLHGRDRRDACDGRDSDNVSAVHDRRTQLLT
jgi:hypothetical protein